MDDFARYPAHDVSLDDYAALRLQLSTEEIEEAIGRTWERILRTPPMRQPPASYRAPRPIWATTAHSEVDSLFARLEQECTEREYEIYRTEPIGRWLTPEESERIVVGYDPVNMKYGIFSDVNDEVALDVTSQQDIQCADEVAVDQFLVACVAGGADA